jgi:hypothetical protein
MKHTHKNNRFFLDFIGKILRRKKCACIWGGSKYGECGQRDFLNGHNMVAGVWGEDVFICNRCYRDDKEEIDEWSKGRRKAVEIGMSNPEYAKWAEKAKDRYFT